MFKVKHVEKLIDIIAFIYLVKAMLTLMSIMLYFMNIYTFFSYEGFFGYYPANYYILFFDIMLSLFSILTAFGLMGREHWARISAIVIAVFGLLDYPVGTLTYLFVLMVMFHPATSKIFGKFIERNIPYRVAGITITLVGLFTFLYLSGYGQIIVEEITYRGFPVSELEPMEKISFEPQRENDVIIVLTAPVKYSLAQQEYLVPMIESLGGEVINRYIYSINGIHAKLSKDALMQIASHPYVKRIYPNRAVYKLTEVREVKCLKDARKLLHFEWLWSHGYDGTNVTVAVIDSGINEDIPQLQRDGKSVVVQSYEKYYDYLSSHGTMVACCIASQDEQYPGGAKNVKLIDVQVFFLDDEGDVVSDDASILWGYDRVVEYKLSHPDEFVIASCSFGIPSILIGDTWDNPAPVSAGANNLVIKYNIPVVGASGNDPTGEHLWINSPGSAQFVLCVGAVDKYLNWQWWSCIGPTPDGHRKPDVVNIGAGVFTFDENGSLRCVDGTSFATPLTTCIIADLATKNMDKKATDFYDAIRKTAIDVHTFGFDYYTGYGFVNPIDASIYLQHLKSYNFYILLSFILTLFGIGIIFYPEWGGGWRI